MVVYTYSFNSLNLFQEHPDNLIEPKLLKPNNSIRQEEEGSIASCEWCIFMSYTVSKRFRKNGGPVLDPIDRSLPRGLIGQNIPSMDL